MRPGPRSTLAAAKQMLTDAGFRRLRDARSSTATCRGSYCREPERPRDRTSRRSSDDLGITATIELQESGAFIDNADGGKLDGIHILGWGADYPDATNFLDYHFGRRIRRSSATSSTTSPDRSQQGATGLDDASRQPSYRQANNAHQDARPDDPDRAPGLGDRLQGRRPGRAQLAARQREFVGHDAG